MYSQASSTLAPESWPLLSHPEQRAGPPDPGTLGRNAIMKRVLLGTVHVLSFSFLPSPRGAQRLLCFSKWLKGTSTAAAPAHQQAR